MHGSGAHPAGSPHVCLPSSSHPPALLCPALPCPCSVTPGKAARWSVSFSPRHGVSTSPVVALINTTEPFWEICKPDAKFPELLHCDVNRVKPLAVEGHWCTRNHCKGLTYMKPTDQCVWGGQGRQGRQG